MPKKKLDTKKEISRLRSEVRGLEKIVTKPVVVDKSTNPFTGIVSGNYWTQTGMPWVTADGRKSVLTEWFWQPIRGQPRRVDTNELRQFSQTFWVFSCVKTILDEVTAVDWDIVPKDGFDYFALEDSIFEMKEFLKVPNKNRESFMDVMRALVKDILEIDAGVLVKVFDVNSYDFDELEPKSGAPMLKPLGERKMLEMYARDGASFLTECDKFGFAKGYWQYSYQIPAHPMWFNRDEICYIKQHNRSMSTYGYSVSQAIMDIIKSLHYSTLYNKRFFEESPIPDGALSLLDTNDTEFKAFVEFWNREFKAQPHKLAVLNKDIKWQPFSVSNNELQFLETQAWYYKMVITAFGLTPSELGLTEDLNRATSATQAEVSKRKAIRPLLKVLENAINETIIPEFGVEGVEFTFVVDDPIDKTQKLNNWQMELNMNVKSVNEIRDEMGLEPVSWGESPANLTQVSTGEQNVEEESQEAVEEAHSTEGNETTRRNEGKKEVDEHIKDPFSQANRPVGNFKSLDKSLDAKEKSEIIREIYDQLSKDIYLILQRQGMSATQAAQYSQALQMRGRTKSLNKSGYATMSYDELIAEHTRLISILEQGTDEEIKLEAQEQKKELETYITQANATRKGIDDGQYYRDSPQVSQTYDYSYFDDANASLISDHRNPDRDKYRSNNQTDGNELSTFICTGCGQTTLAFDNTDDLVAGNRRVKCGNCGKVYNETELFDQAVLDSFKLTLERNPEEHPKALDDSIHAHKSFEFAKNELDMNLKEFAGFDYSKSLREAVDYANSEEYFKLLYGYLNENVTRSRPMAEKRVKQVISVIAEGVKNNLTVDDIKRKLMPIVKDVSRAEGIARTESIRIINQGNIESMKARGQKSVIWIAGGDERTCPDCEHNNGKSFPINKTEGLIPSHTNCRCRFA